MEIDGKKIAIGIVGGIMAGFSLGVGFYLANRMLHKTPSISTPTPDKEISQELSFEGNSSYSPQRPMQNHLPQRQDSYQQFNGPMPNRPSSMAGGFDFSTGQSIPLNGPNWQ